MCRRHLLTLLLLSILILLAPDARAAVDRSFQPVIITGNDMPSLLNTPIDQLFVYAYRNGAWTQIPFQIDEKTTDSEGQRIYTAAGDGQLDADEELVFMLKDLGKRAPRSVWVDGAEADLRYEIVVDAGQGVLKWGYVYHGEGLSRTFTQDYVRFVGSAERIIAENYTVAYLPEAFGLSELTLNNSGVNILDRTKLRLRITIPFLGSVTYTEEDLPIERPPVTPVKDGPVRLVLGERGGFAYGNLFHTRTDVDLSDSLPPFSTLSYIRFSSDFNLQAVTTPTATIYLDATITQPVEVDGQPDEVPREPVPAWRQISHSTGTIIAVSDISGLDGTPHNYYRDDVRPAEGDTGDGHSYGEFGFEVDNPNPHLRIESTLLILDPVRDRVGPDYAAAMTTPPPVAVTSQARESARWVFLPLTRR